MVRFQGRFMQVFHVAARSLQIFLSLCSKWDDMTEQILIIIEYSLTDHSEKFSRHAIRTVMYQ
jgi:hypothetical protein